MKKLISILLSLITVICIVFVGCDNNQATNESPKEDGTTEQLPEEEPLEVKGKFYTLKVAYENGWLNEDDLKSIACQYYEFYKYENPYNGMFDPHEELSEENEREIKQAYLSQVLKYPEGSIENVTVYRYYGTYNGNIVVGVSSDYVDIDLPYIPSETEIGGVIFKNFWEGDVRVYHEGKQISKIETRISFGEVLIYYDPVRTFDFLTGIVTDTATMDDKQINFLLDRYNENPEYFPDHDSAEEYEKYLRDYYNTPEQVSTFTKEEAASFEKAIDSLGIKTWNEEYSDNSYTCGSWYYVTIIYTDGTQQRTGFYDVYPTNYKAIENAFEEYLGAGIYCTK